MTINTAQPAASRKNKVEWRWCKMKDGTLKNPKKRRLLIEANKRSFGQGPRLRTIHSAWGRRDPEVNGRCFGRGPRIRTIHTSECGAVKDGWWLVHVIMSWLCTDRPSNISFIIHWPRLRSANHYYHHHHCQRRCYTSQSTPPSSYHHYPTSLVVVSSFVVRRRQWWYDDGGWWWSSYDYKRRSRRHVTATRNN